ncbi:MAG: hypothetical protein JSV80_14005 [Acidobacteriota bacterium]|nr:MAG: hypothetical protein JSV80_14005 [Acidobacteriota bacterium]
MGRLIRETVDLIGLELALARGRWRRARAAERRAVGVLAGGLPAAVAGTLLVAGALLLALVGAAIVFELTREGETARAGTAAGMLADGGVALVLLAMAVSDPLRAAADRRPLRVLPVSASARLAAETVSVLTVQPSAAIVWPTAIGLLAGAVAMAGAGGALRLAPAAAGVLVLSVGAALVLKRLTALAWASPRRGAAAQALAVVLLVGLIGSELGSGVAGRAEFLLPIPGALIRGAFASPSIVYGLIAASALIASGVALLLLAARLPSPESSCRLRRAHGPRHVSHSSSSRRGWVLDLTRVWAARRSCALLTGGLASGLALAFLGELFRTRALEDLALAAGLGGCWVVVSSSHPLFANVLGLGGRAGAGIGLLPVSGMRLLLPGLLAVTAPIAAGVLAVSGVPFLFGGAASSSLVLCAAGTSLVWCAVGAGAWLSVRWPRPVQLEGRDPTLWPAGPSRLLMLAAEAVALGPLLLRPEGSIVAGTSVSLLLSALVALGGLVAASRRLDRQRTRFTEALLA